MSPPSWPAFCALLLAPAASAAPRGEDALVFVADDVGYEDLEEARLLGLTPSLDQLAARGVTFTAARSNATCSPGRSSLVTGLWYAGERGETCTNTPGDPIPAPVVTIAELDPSSTDALFGKYHLGNNPNGPWLRSNLYLGFELWRSGTPTNVTRCFGVDYFSWRRIDDGVDQFFTGYQPIAVRDAALAWWTGPVRSTRPRLMFVCPQLAHGPFHVPPAQLLPRGLVVGTSKRERYLAMIAAMDHVLGSLLAVVDLKSTLFVFVSDNGTPREVAPDPTRAKTTTFERGVRVPLVVAGPGFAPGRVDERLAHVADVLPTVARFRRVACPPADGLALQLPYGHDAVVVTGSDEMAAVGFGLKLRRAKGVEQLFLLPDENIDLIGSPALAPLEARLRGHLEEFASR